MEEGEEGQEDEGKSADRSAESKRGDDVDVIPREEHEELVAILEEEMVTMRLGFEKRVGELEHELEASKASFRRS